MSEQIVVLTEREKVRKRINVWHGSSSNWFNMIKELTGNSLDILMKNDSDNGRIDITLYNNNLVRVRDNASGMPLELIANDGTPNYIAIFEKLFAGSNYEATSSTVGQNGIFNCSLAYSCSELTVTVGRPDGNIYQVKYKDGFRQGDLKIIGETTETFTDTLFSLDTTIWDKPDFKFDDICNFVDGQASLGNVKITVKDEQNDSFKEFYYEEGIKSYFNALTSNKTFISKNLAINKDTESEVENKGVDNIKLNLIFGFSNDSNDNIQKDYLNTADLILHGTIQDGIILGFKNSIHNFLKSEGLYNKTDKNISIEDVSISLNYISDVRSNLVEYVSQVKQQTLCPHYKKVLKTAIEEYLETWFVENKTEATNLCKQILINSKARLKSEATRSRVSQELSKDASTAGQRPKKFTPCVSKDKTKRRLALMEGNSALTPILKSRNKIYLALYALKGKIIGCIKNNIDDILENQEIKDIFKILGCGMEYKNKVIKGIKKYCEEDLQYEEIDIMSDFDADGVGHIAPLVICMFYMLAPKIIENGHLYILNTPLYGISYKKEFYYAYSDAEKDEIIKKYNMDNSREVFRYKGLGSLSTQNLIDTAMNEDNCVKDIVTMESAETCYEAMMLCFSDDKKNERKSILETRGNEFTDMMEVQ